MHFYFQNTVAGTCLTTSALHIKTEPAFGISFGFCIRRGCKQITNLVKNPCISCRIGTGRSADGRLVNIYHLVQMLHPLDGFVFPRNHSGTVQIPCQAFVENFIGQRGFSGTGYSRNAGHYPQRNLHINILQVIFPGTFDFQKTCGFSSGFRNRYFNSAAQISSCDRFLILHNFLSCSLGHQTSAMLSCSRPDIHNMICCKHGVFIMLHYNQCISQIFQIPKGIQQLVIIPLVQADTGLIQNIGHSYQS